jgi:protein-L-isoaspartate(D-aspartate) O-methyltransferase
VDSALAAQAYEDTSLPIGLGQTISKPSVVGRMLSLLHEGARVRELGHLGKALEIGTGCGYQAALLCLLARQVVSIERLAPLHEQARQRLDPWRGRGLMLIWGDGRLGHGPSAPYDSMVATAGADEVPPAWLEQLAVGGRLVAPVHSQTHGGHMLLVVDRREGGYTHTLHEPVHFVPLKSGAQ